jgi:hypothetical protein
MLHIHARVSGVFICMLQVFYLNVAYVCIGYTHDFMFFLVFLQVFQSVLVVLEVYCKCFIWEAEGMEAWAITSASNWPCWARACAGRSKQRGMEAGACGPVCMRAWEVEGA